MIRIIFNARSALFFGLLMGVIPTFPAQQEPAAQEESLSLAMPVDEDGKAEKKVAAEQVAVQQEEKKKKETALPAQISFEIPDHVLKKIDKEGQVVAETLSMTDGESETFTGQSFSELIKDAMSQHKIPLIARVVTIYNERQEVHYFDIESIHTQIAQFRRIQNPLNRQPIQELSYFAYIPQLKRFVYVDNTYLQVNVENLVLEPVDQIHDTAMSILLGEAYIEEDKNKSIEIYRYLINYSTVPQVKNQARCRLAFILRERNVSRNEEAQEACNLFESLIDVNGDISKDITEENSITVFLNLANGYHVDLFDAPWTEKNSEAALYYAMRVINHAYWDSLLLISKVMMYAIAGEQLIKKCIYYAQEDSNEKNIISFLETGLKLLGESQDELSLNLKARLHANLAVAYSNDELVKVCGYKQVSNRNQTIWGHCSKALERYNVVGNGVKGFLPLMIRMRYFGIGNDGDVKEALKYMEMCKEKNDDQVLAVIRCHRDYYHTPSEIGSFTLRNSHIVARSASDKEKVLKELAKKEKALDGLEAIVEYEPDNSVEVCFSRAILGKIYAEKSQKAFEQAQLYAETDQLKESLLCDKESIKFHKKAQEYMQPLLELPQHKDTYPWALAQFTCGHIAKASKDDKKAGLLFDSVLQSSSSFPRLLRDATFEMYRLGILDLDACENHEVYNTKNPNYYAMQLQEAANRLSKARDKGALDELEPHFIGIAKKAPLCMDRMRAQGALKEIAERRKKLGIATSSAQSVSMSLDSTLDGETKAKTAAASTGTAMDESSDADPKRGTKRKADGEAQDVPAKNTRSKSRGNGSGSGSGPLVLADKS